MAGRGLPQHVSSASAADGKVFFAEHGDFLFRSNEGRTPTYPVAHVSTRLADVGQNELVWLGHSGYFLRIEGVSMLIDPALTYAAPIPGVVKPFTGADVFQPSALPDVDLLLITHDHYDHLDLRVIEALTGRVGRVVTALGVGAHLESWGWPAEKITELEWWESTRPLPDIEITLTTSLHFSGRSMTRFLPVYGASAFFNLPLFLLFLSFQKEERSSSRSRKTPLHSSASPLRHWVNPVDQPTHLRAFQNMRIQPESFVHSAGCQESCTARRLRSGCGMMIVKRPSSFVNAARPSAEPFGLNG